MAKIYQVQTRDVDGASARKYATFAAAQKRFTEMAGRTNYVARSDDLRKRAEDPDAPPAPADQSSAAEEPAVIDDIPF